MPLQLAPLRATTPHTLIAPRRVRSDQGVAGVLITERRLRRRVRALAALIAADFWAAEQPPILLGVLTGAAPFLSDLARALTIPCEIAYVGASSYHGGRSSSGSVEVSAPLGVSKQIQGRAVVVVEDVLDSGLTLATLLDLLHEQRPSSLSACVLLDKCLVRTSNDGRYHIACQGTYTSAEQRARLRAQQSVRYVGFHTPRDAFVVGYGMDDRGLYRNLPYIGVMRPLSDTSAGE